MVDVLFVAVPILILVAMFVGLMAQHRYLRHRELMTLAERGLVPPSKRRQPRKLNAALTLSAIGLALCIGMQPLSADAFPKAPLGMSPIMLVGLIPLFIGLAQLLSWQLGRGELEPEAGRDEPWFEPTQMAYDEEQVAYEEQAPGHELPDVPGWLEEQGEPLPPGAAARAAARAATQRSEPAGQRG